MCSWADRFLSQDEVSIDSEGVGSNPDSMNAVWKFSAPEILQRPESKQGSLPISAPRPERPCAPAVAVRVLRRKHGREPVAGPQAHVVDDGLVRRRRRRARAEGAGLA